MTLDSSVAVAQNSLEISPGIEDAQDFHLIVGYAEGYRYPAVEQQRPQARQKVLTRQAALRNPRESQAGRLDTAYEVAGAVSPRVGGNIIVEIEEILFRRRTKDDLRVTLAGFRLLAVVGAKPGENLVRRPARPIVGQGSLDLPAQDLVERRLLAIERAQAGAYHLACRLVPPGFQPRFDALAIAAQRHRNRLVRPHVPILSRH